MKKIEKGGIIMVAGIWYVIVNAYHTQDGVSFDCICDHANNAHYWAFYNVEFIASLKEIADFGFSSASEELKDLARSRELPYDVVVEVLAGAHDDRFSRFSE